MIAHGAKLSPQQWDLYYFSEAEKEATKQLQKLDPSFYNISAADLLHYTPGSTPPARYGDFLELIIMIRQLGPATRDHFMSDFFLPSLDKWRQYANRKRSWDQKMQQRGMGGGGGGGGVH